MNRTPFSVPSFILPASDPRRAVALYQTYRIEQGEEDKDDIRQKVRGPLSGCHGRMDLYLTIFFLGATLGETTANLSRRSIAAVYPPPSTPVSHHSVPAKRCRTYPEVT